MAKKEKQTVWLYPETKELISKHLDAAAVQNDSQFIEKAVNFYRGRVTACDRPQRLVWHDKSVVGKTPEGYSAGLSGRA